MKRVRTEQIQFAVAQYLKRRQYVESDGSMKGAKLLQSPEEMAASLTGEAARTGTHSLTLLNRTALGYGGIKDRVCLVFF